LEHFLEEVSFFYTKFAVCKANLETTQLHFSLNQMCVKEKKQRLVRCFFFGYDIPLYYDTTQKDYHNFPISHLPFQNPSKQLTTYLPHHHVQPGNLLDSSRAKKKNPV